MINSMSFDKSVTQYTPVQVLVTHSVPIWGVMPGIPKHNSLLKVDKKGS